MLNAGARKYDADGTVAKRCRTDGKREIYAVAVNEKKPNLSKLIR